MFDIVKCKADAKGHGFERLYAYEEARPKIAIAKDLAAAAEIRGKATLIVVEDISIDEGATRLLGERPKSKACLLIDLSRIMKSTGTRRAVEMSMHRNLLRLCVKHGAFYAFATLAEKEEEIRTPDEMAHIAMLLGINRGQAGFALGMLGQYL